MKDSKKQSNILESDLPKDPCYLCLVAACCDEPCSILTDYMSEVYDLAESDLNHPILDRFPKYLKESIIDFVKSRKDIDDQYEKLNKEGKL
jgi:hypothetical protein